MMLAEGGVEVLDELSREPHGKLSSAAAMRFWVAAIEDPFVMPPAGSRPVRTINTVATTEGRSQPGSFTGTAGECANYKTCHFDQEFRSWVGSGSVLSCRWRRVSRSGSTPFVIVGF